MKYGARNWKLGTGGAAWECQAEADPGGITIAVTESCRARGQSASVVMERGLKER